MTRRPFSFLVLGGLLLVQGFTIFTRGGYFRLYWIPSGLLIGLLMAACLLAWNHRWLRPRFNLKTDLPLLGWLGWAALSWLTSVNREETQFEVVRLFTLAMVYFMVAYALPEAPGKKVLAFGLVGLALAESAYGLLLFTAQKPMLHLSWLELPLPGAWVSGTFLNHNHFSGLMSMAVCLGFGLIIAVGRRGQARSEMIAQRLFLAIPCAVMLLGLVLALSRGGWVSFLLTVPFFLALLWWNAHPLWSRVIAVALAMGLIVLVFILGMNREPLLRRVEGLEALYRQPEEMTTDIRLSLWKSTLGMIRDHPWTGTGWGTYRSVYPAYRLGSDFQSEEFAHNDYLQIAAGMGLPGLGFFLLFLVMLFWDGFRVIATRMDDFWTLAMPGLLAGLFVILLHELVDFNLMLPSNLMFFLSLAGLVAGRAQEQP